MAKKLPKAPKVKHTAKSTGMKRTSRTPKKRGGGGGY
jgi:hypothetical protein